MTPGISSWQTDTVVIARHLTLVRFWRDEGGMLSMVNTLAVAFCTVLIVLLLNVGHLVHQKVELQNTADAVAYSGALWQARGMNAITATNHVIGEMLAFVTIHEAVGGWRLDESTLGAANTVAPDVALDIAYWGARGVGTQTPAYKTVRERRGVHADRTLLQSKRQLKWLLADVYGNKIYARYLQLSPETAERGRELEEEMNDKEDQIGREYQTLNVFHRVARSMMPLKQILRDELLPAAKRYTIHVVREVPRLAQQTAQEIAGRNAAQGCLYPTQPELPVALDPFARALLPLISDRFRLPGREPMFSADAKRATNLRKQVVKTSQLCRATFPWVNYHRQPIIDGLELLVPLSGAGQFYYEQTTAACIYLSDHLQQSVEHDLGLYVLHGYPAPDKGYELWSEAHPRYADELFSVVGMAYRGPPVVTGQPGFFRQAHPLGRVALAQGLVYNGNQERRNPHYIDLDIKRLAPERQADVGWDTLNWQEGSRPFELVATKTRPEYPQIRVNWQAKLVPLSANRLAEVQRTTELPTSFREITQRLLPRMPRSLRTH